MPITEIEDRLRASAQSKKAGATCGVSLVSADYEAVTRAEFYAEQNSSGGRVVANIKDGSSNYFAQVLGTSGESSFLQLPSPGAHKTESGEAVAIWIASKESTTVTVLHQLGLKPKVTLTVENNVGSVAAGLTPVLIERTASKFKFKVSCNESISTEMPVCWTAMS